MYPSIIRAHNINRETMIGKIILTGCKHLNPDPNDEMYDQGRAFIESVLARDWIDCGKKYFNLGSTEELLKELEGKK